MLKDYFIFTFRNLRKRKTRSYLTMIGIFIGIAAVVSLISLGEGLRVAIMSQFGFLSTDVLAVRAGGVQMGSPGTGVINPLTVDDAEEIAKLPGVRASIPRLTRSAKIEFNHKQRIEYAVSIPSGKERKEIERIVNLEADKGRLLKDGDTYSVVLGANYNKDRKFGKPIEVGRRVIIEGKTFEVVGILKKKGNFMIDNIIAMNENIMRDLYDDKEKADIISVIVKNQNEIDTVKGRVEKRLRKLRGVKKGEEDFSVETPQNAIKTLNDTLFAVQLFVYIIAGISLVVGGIGIMNTMYTAVLERTKEIGIMKAIGAKNSDIFLLFFTESGFLGTIGGLTGILIGVGLASGLSFLGNMSIKSGLIQAHFSWWLLTGALLFSFILGSIAGLIPAINAAKLKPVDALRYAK